MEGKSPSPRRQAEGDASGRKSASPGIPFPDPLPTWANLPLEAKLPMIPGPKGAADLWTTNLGDKKHKSSTDLDFDLTDPNSMLLSNDYKPLHDPHLKPHLTAPYMQRRLQHGGFITHDGRVLCTLKEFNEYRKYLRKINLALEQRKAAKQAGYSPRKQMSDAAAIAQCREERVKEVRQRLAAQHKEDKERLQRIVAEEEERRLRLRQEQLARVTEKEQRQRASHERRQIILKRRQREEHMRKMALLHKWYKEDAMRRARAEARRKYKDTERQRRIEENWELRKRVQQARIDEEQRKKEQEENRRRKRITERDQMVRKLRQREQTLFMHLTQQKRWLHKRTEEEYARKFAKTVETKRGTSSQRHKQKSRSGVAKQKRVSNWDIEDSILFELGGDFEDQTNLLDMILDEEIARLEHEKQLENSASQLGLSDFKGANFSDEVVRIAEVKLSDGHVQQSEEASKPVGDIPLFDFRGATFTEEFQDQDTSDTLEPKLEILRPSFNELVSTSAAKISSMVAVLNSERMKQRRPTPVVHQPDFGHGDIKGYVPSLDAMGEMMEEEDEEDEYMEDTDEDEEVETADNIEEAAKAIVDMSLFITSQVIYPAYVRWLQEDHPEKYLELFDEDGQAQANEDGDGADEVGEPLKEKAQTSQVRFSMIEDVIPPSELDQLSLLANQWDQVEDKDNMKDELEGDDMEDELEFDEDEDDGSALVGVKDSLTLLQRLSETSTFETTTMIELLQRILSALSEGNINPEEMQKLGILAMEITARLSVPGADRPMRPSPEAMLEEPEEPEEDVAKEPSGTSVLAEQIVADTMERVQKQLLQDHERSVNEMMSSPSINTMAQLIAQKAIAMAVQTLEQHTSQEGPRPISARAERPGSAPALASPSPDHRRTSMTPTGTELYTASKFEYDPIARQYKDTHSETSNIVWAVMKKVADEIEDEIKKIATPGSDTSLFIKDMLATVASELRQSPITPEAPVNWDAAKPMSPFSSDASCVTNFVKTTLTKVVQDMEDDGSIPMDSSQRSGSSIFAEGLVRETLIECLKDLRGGMMNPSQVMQLATSIINTHKCMDKTSSSATRATYTKSLDGLPATASTNNMLTEQLVKETLQRVQQDIIDGTIDNQDLSAMAENIQFSKADGELRSDTSVMAETCVQRALGDAVHHARNTPPTKISPTKTGSKYDKRSDASLLAEEAVKSAIKGVLNKTSSTGLDLFPRGSIGRSPIDIPAKSPSSLVAVQYVQQAIEDVLSEISAKPPKPQIRISPKSSQSKEIGTFVDNFLQNLVEELRTEPAGVDQAIAAVVKRSLEELKVSPRSSQTEQAYHSIEDHVMLSDHSFHEESSSDEEMDVVPMMGDAPVPISHHVVENNLAILSCRKDHDIDHPTDPGARYSFRSLDHPDISKVRRLSVDSASGRRLSIDASTGRRLSIDTSSGNTMNESLGEVSKHYSQLSAIHIAHVLHQDETGSDDEVESNGSASSVSSEENLTNTATDKELCTKELHSSKSEEEVQMLLHKISSKELENKKSDAGVKGTKVTKEPIRISGTRIGKKKSSETGKSTTPKTSKPKISPYGVPQITVTSKDSLRSTKKANDGDVGVKTNPTTSTRHSMASVSSKHDRNVKPTARVSTTKSHESKLPTKIRSSDTPERKQSDILKQVANQLEEEKDVPPKISKHAPGKTGHAASPSSRGSGKAAETVKVPSRNSPQRSEEEANDGEDPSYVIEDNGEFVVIKLSNSDNAKLSVAKRTSSKKLKATTSSSSRNGTTCKAKDESPYIPTSTKSSKGSIKSRSSRTSDVQEFTTSSFHAPAPADSSKTNSTKSSPHQSGHKIVNLTPRPSSAFHKSPTNSAHSNMSNNNISPNSSTDNATSQSKQSMKNASKTEKRTSDTSAESRSSILLTPKQSLSSLDALGDMEAHEVHMACTVSDLDNAGEDHPCQGSTGSLPGLGHKDSHHRAHHGHQHHKGKRHSSNQAMKTTLDEKQSHEHAQEKASTSASGGKG